MKRLLQGILILCLLFSTSNVKAEESKEVFFTNKNNISFTKFQYDTLIEAMGLYEVLNMDELVYNNMHVSMMNENDTKLEILEDNDVIIDNGGISLLDTRYHETTYKKLTGVTTCPSGYSYCYLDITLSWKKNPSVRSYDVIGTMLHGTTFYGDASTVSTFMNGTTTSFSVEKKETNGRAAAVKLASSGNINSIVFSTNVNKAGSLQVSYQHAVKTVTKSYALSFEFSNAGMGKVFYWSDGYAGYYDDMAGLSLNIP